MKKSSLVSLASLLCSSLFVALYVMPQIKDTGEPCVPIAWYIDNDNDGCGNVATSLNACDQPTGYVSDNTDCDDTDPDRFPTNTEICDDGIDQDCDGSDLDCDDVDDDEDGMTENDGDCDDMDPSVNPAATENNVTTCNDGVDNDCDGDIDQMDWGCQNHEVNPE